MSSLHCANCDSALEQGDLRCPICARIVPVEGDGPSRPAIEVLRCDSCGAFNEAHAQSCTNCGSPRSADAPPPGGLTLAAAPQRERPLPLESCGFAPSEAEDGGGEAG